jgi:hypothetical protein
MNLRHSWRARTSFGQLSQDAAERRAYQAGSRFRRRTADRNNRTKGSGASVGLELVPISR